jgi:hypothetical protein
MKRTKPTDFTMDDFRAEMQRRDVYGTSDVRSKIAVPSVPKPAPTSSRREEHGNSIVRTVPCGVHPLHSVKVRTNGSRSGCPMCEMQIESLCRTPTGPTRSPVPRDHAPMITHGRFTRIVGCTCGWRTPPGAADSDDTYVAHATVMR